MFLLVKKSWFKQFGRSWWIRGHSVAGYSHTLHLICHILNISLHINLIKLTGTLATQREMGWTLLPLSTYQVLAPCHLLVVNWRWCLWISTLHDRVVCWRILLIGLLLSPILLILLRRLLCLSQYLWISIHVNRVLRIKQSLVILRIAYWLLLLIIILLSVVCRTRLPHRPLTHCLSLDLIID